MSTFVCVQCQFQFDAPESEHERELFCPRCGSSVVGSAITAEKPTSLPDFTANSATESSTAITASPSLSRQLRQQFPDGLPPQLGRLGPVRAQFWASRVQRWIAGCFGIAVGALALVFCAAVVRILFDPSEGNLGKRFMTVLRPIWIIAFLAAIAGFVLRKALQRVDQSAVVFTDGIALIEGRSISSMRWDDVDVVREGVGGLFLASAGIVKTRAMELQDRQGRTLVLTDALSKFAKLTEMVHIQVVERQLPAARAAFAAGQTMRFGEVAMDGQQLTIPGAVLPWTEVESLRVEGDTLVVRKRQGFFSMNSADIPIALHVVPNVYVLMALATDVLKRIR